MGSVDQRTIEYLIKAKDMSSSTFSAFEKKLGAALSTAVILKFAKDAAFAADALEGLQNRASVVFGESFPKVLEEANALAQGVKRASDQLLEMRTSFAGVLTGAGVTGQMMTDMSGRLTKLSVDFASFHRIADSEAFSLMQGAILGQTRALGRMGVVMNDGTLEAYRLSMGIKQSAKDMSDAQLVVLRYNYLLDKTKKQQGDATKNSDKFGNAVKSLSGAWEDFMQRIGTPILPALASTISKAVSLLGDLAEAMFIVGNQAKNMWSAVANTSYGKFVSGNFSKIFGSSTNGIMGAGVDANTMSTGFGPVGGGGKSFDDIKREEELQDQIGFMNKLGQGAGGAGETAEKAAEKVKDAMTTMRQEYADTRDSVSDALVDLEIEHSDKMDEIDNSIKKVSDSIKKLNDDYQKAVGEMTDTKFDSIIEQQKKVKEMQDELKRSTNDPSGLGLDQIKNIIGSLANPSEGVSANDAQWLHLTSGVEKQVELYLKLQKEQAALNSFLESNKEILNDPEFKEAQDRAEMTGFEKDMALNKERIDERNTEHTAEIARLEDEKTKLEESKNKEIELYETRKQALNDTLVELDNFRNIWQQNMQNIDRTTEEIVNNLKKKLEELRTTISSIDALMQKRADVTGGGTLTSKVKNRYGGGDVRLGEYTIVGEDGPELAKFPPGTHISSATQTEKELGGRRGGGITVQGPLIGTVHVQNKSDVDMLMAELARKLELIPQGSS